MQETQGWSLGWKKSPEEGNGYPLQATCDKSSGKKDLQGTTGSPVHLIIKDLGEIHSSLLDHKLVIQGKTHYFVIEFEEKRGLQKMQFLEKLKTNERTLLKCRKTMQDNLNQVLQRLQAATDSVCRLQQRKQERKKKI